MAYSFPNVIYRYLLLTLALIKLSNGGFESGIVCRFSEEGDNLFWTGEFVSGAIEFHNIDHKDLKLKSIDAELIGEFVYITEDRRNNVTSRTTHRETFFKKVLTLQSASDEGNFYLTYGNNVWPFRFLLDDSLPPSLEQSRFNDPYIHYFLHIAFVRPEWYRWNIKKLFPIVINHASPSVNASQLEAHKTNRKGVYLQIILHKSVVSAGSNLSFAVTVRNPKKSLIYRISMRLIGYVELDRAKHEYHYLLDENLERIHRFQEIHLHENFQLLVPHITLPTFKFYLSSTYGTRTLVVRYALHFEAHLRGFFTNIRLQLPLVINNHPENN